MGPGRVPGPTRAYAPASCSRRPSRSSSFGSGCRCAQPFRTAREHDRRARTRCSSASSPTTATVGARSARETTPTYAPETLDTARLVLRDELVPRLFAGAGFDDVRGHHAGPGRARERVARRAAARRGHLARVVPRRRPRTHVDAGRRDRHARRRRRARRRRVGRVRRGRVPQHQAARSSPVTTSTSSPRCAPRSGPTSTLAGRRERQLHARRRRPPRARSTSSTSRASSSRSHPTRSLDHARLAGTAAHADRPRRDDHERARRARRDRARRVRGREHQGRARRRARRGAPRCTTCASTPASRRARGGMLETGIGRAALVALASLPGFTVTGDLSASSRYFDARHHRAVRARRRPARGARPGPASASTPLPDVLARCTIARERLTRADARARSVARAGSAGGSRSHGRTITIESSGWSGSSRSTIGSVNGGSPE